MLRSIPMRKTCGSCGKSKLLTEFTEKKPGLHQSRCKECVRVYARAHYAQNKKLYTERNKRHWDKRREWYNSLKDKPCLDCGQSFPSCAMEFDHRDGEKKQHTISKLITSKLIAKKRILAEIAKCDLVCVLCHRLRTCKRDHRHHACKA